MALVGRIGESGMPFPILSHSRFTAQGSGELLLAVNEDVLYEDGTTTYPTEWLENWGVFRARVFLTSQHGAASGRVLTNGRPLAGIRITAGSQRTAVDSDEGIDFSDIPKLGPDFWKKAELRMPEKEGSVTIRLDHDVVTWFRGMGRGYQTKINAVLRAYMESTRHI